MRLYPGQQCRRRGQMAGSEDHPATDMVHRLAARGVKRYRIVDRAYIARCRGQFRLGLGGNVCPVRHAVLRGLVVRLDQI